MMNRKSNSGEINVQVDNVSGTEFISDHPFEWVANYHTIEVILSRGMNQNNNCDF